MHPGEDSFRSQYKDTGTNATIKSSTPANGLGHKRDSSNNS